MIDQVHMDYSEFEKKLGVENLFNSQMNKLTPEQQAIYSEVPENVKKHFIEICITNIPIN